MPSLKPNKGAKKRFRVTRNGKVVRRAAATGHLRAKKSGKRKRGQRRAKLVHPSEVKKIKKLLAV
ncbi:MAG: 50S ribosomal protein L35 [Planctomycetota bacterium]|nr:MAG: 50S ribosomal protein L35 [Planctomycetota bacterium]